MVTGESKNGPPSERLLDVPVGEANRFKSPLGFRRPEMASLIWDRSLRLGHSKRNSFSSVAYDSAAINMSSSSTTSSFTGTTNSLSAALPSPFGDVSLSDADLRASAYEIFLAATRSSSSKPLIYTSNNQNNNNCIKQRWSLTSTATSKMNVWKTTLPRLPKKDNLQSSPPRLTMKKALGLRSSSKRGSEGRSPGSSCSGGKIKKPMTVGELMRVQMRVSDALDSRLRRGLLRISAGQVGKRIESMVLPLELLQQFKAITTIPDAPIPIYIFGFLPFHKEQDLEPACSINPNTLFFQYTLKIISSPFFLFLKWSISQQILSSTLTAMLGWADKRLLAYHGTFDSRKIDSIQSIVSIGISAAKILVEDISNDVDEEKTKLMWHAAGLTLHQVISLHRFCSGKFLSVFEFSSSNLEENGKGRFKQKIIKKPAKFPSCPCYSCKGCWGSCNERKGHIQSYLEKMAPFCRRCCCCHATCLLWK
ncbi:Hypothetical predicted protein [Olea europaea subsp. europaea]|uniref:Uncharacterized protein n=1 Tax=Olea europaea subsp. europaea TaxID=158383 RepID=A0A8S0PIQ1_OLEEU|nr:Hypothetical predicted protein [Olea europaea subsp. europaea]